VPRHTQQALPRRSRLRGHPNADRDAIESNTIARFIYIEVTLLRYQHGTQQTKERVSAATWCSKMLHFPFEGEG
jgi:hypothetical protein